ncbi:MAG: lipopolysaccharide biosynthesis protein [Thermomonas sp.]
MQKQDIPTLTHRATHAAWWSALEIASRYGVQFVVTIVLARLLHPADFGMVAMLLVFTLFAALMVDGGFGIALVQKQVPTENDETTAFLTSLAAGIALALALWLAAPAIAGFYSQPELTRLMRLLVLTLPMGAIAAVPNAVLTLRLDFRTRAAAEFIASLCSGVLAVALAWRGFGVWSLVWQSVAGAAMRALLLWMFSGWRPRGRFDMSAFRGLFRFGGYMLLANALNTVSVRLQSLLIGRVLDARSLGFYSLAQDTQQAPAQFMGGLLNRVGLPVFSTVADQPAKLAGAMRLSLRLAIFVFAPCMAGIALVAKPLIIVLYGAKWAPAAPVLSVLALAAMFWPLHVLNLAAIGARGRSDLVFRLEIAKFLVSAPLVVLGSMHGIQAVAWAVLITGVLAIFINTRHAKALVGYGAFEQLRDQSATLLLTAASIGAAWLAMRWTKGAPMSLAMAVLVAVFVYVAGAASTKIAPWRESIELWKAFRMGRIAPAKDLGR